MSYVMVIIIIITRSKEKAPLGLILGTPVEYLLAIGKKRDEEMK